jgi:hypothetical protein
MVVVLQFMYEEDISGIVLFEGMAYRYNTGMVEGDDSGIAIDV